MNWMDAIANDYASNQRVTVDISGGTETLRYSFVAAAYNERGILKRDKSYDWDPTIKLQRYNVRSNVDLKLSPTTQLRFNIGGYLQDRNSTTKDISQISRKRSLLFLMLSLHNIPVGRYRQQRSQTFGHGLLKVDIKEEATVRLKHCFL